MPAVFHRLSWFHTLFSNIKSADQQHFFSFYLLRFTSTFSRIPFDTDIAFPCVLCTHNSDNRKPVKQLVRKMISYYEKADLKL